MSKRSREDEREVLKAHLPKMEKRETEETEEKKSYYPEINENGVIELYTTDEFIEFEQQSMALLSQEHVLEAIRSGAMDLPYHPLYQPDKGKISSNVLHFMSQSAKDIVKKTVEQDPIIQQITQE